MIKVWILTVMFVTNGQYGQEARYVQSMQMQTYVNLNSEHCESLKRFWVKKHPTKVLLAECTVQVIPK